MTESKQSSPPPKVLLLDDEQELLETYRELLSRLSSKPEIHICNSGARALALLESEPFHLMISDLRMPRMDGLQVLSIVRRKYPNLRIIVLTGITDEHFRSRAYALGIDMYWQKPSNSQEIKMFMDCVESLLEREEQTGFRGVQSKSLVDLVQLECLSQSSSVLRISNGSREGRIWIANGEIIDAATQELGGEQAFQRILSWKTGTFEIFPPEPDRPRTIHTSVHGLLLESAQTLDEAMASAPAGVASGVEGSPPAAGSPLARFASHRGVQFVLATGLNGRETSSWGLDNPEPVAHWTSLVLRQFRSLGEKLHAGELKQIECIGLQQHAGLGCREERGVCFGLDRQLTAAEVQETTRALIAEWDS